MKVSGFRPISSGFVALAILAAIAGFLVVSRDNTQAIGNYNATFTFKLCNTLPAAPPWVAAGLDGNPACADNLALGANPDTTIRLNIPNENLNFSEVVNYFPNAFTIAAGTTMAPGEKVGGGANLATLGVLNNKCNIGFDVNFIFSNIALPNNPGDPRASTNIAFPTPEGTTDRFGHWTTIAPNGTALVGFGALEKHDQSTGGLATAGYDPGENIYRDVDNSGTVTVGDIRLNGKNGGSAHANYPPLSVAGALDDDVVAANPLVAFAAAEKHVDPANAGVWDQGEQVYSDNGNGIVGAGDTVLAATMPTDATTNIADSSILGIQNYPSYLLDLFDPDFTPGVGDAGNVIKPIMPIAVYGGITQPKPASSDWTPLYFVQFAAGALAAFPVGHPFHNAVAALGQPAVAVLTDPTVVKASVQAISDFCGPLISTTMLWGKSAGADGIHGNGDDMVRLTSPAAAGTQMRVDWTMSYRDADSDGRENNYDTCPVTADVPAGKDSDGDGIYDSCDPQPLVPDGSDIDGDQFLNRQDNCPQVLNGLGIFGDGQLESEQTVLTANYLLAAPDGGPKTDSIGDACEVVAPPVGTGTNKNVADGDWAIRAQLTAKCIGGVDLDGDGYCAADKDAGSDAATNCSNNTNEDLADDATVIAAGAGHLTAVVNDGCPGAGPPEYLADNKTKTLGHGGGGANAGIVSGAAANAVGAAVGIATSSVANPTVITTAAAHGLANGDVVLIAGHAGSTPSINGFWTVSNVVGLTFNIPVNVTVAGAGGTVTRQVTLSDAGALPATFNPSPQALDLVGALVEITSGTGAGQVRTIIGNSATGMALDNPWTIVPVAGNSYVIHDACNNNTDDDGDGVVNDGCPQVGATAEAGADQAKHTGWACPAAPLPGATVQCNLNTDNDLLPAGCVSPNCTFFSDWQETFMRTDATRKCARTAGANNEPEPDSWPYDFNDDQMATLPDVLKYIPVFNSTGNSRFDMNQDGQITLPDVLKFIPVFNSSCL